MKIQRLLMLTGQLVVLLFTLAASPVVAQDVSPVLRGRALEIGRRARRVR